MRDIINITQRLFENAGWRGSERCWWNPKTGSVIPVEDHEEHADVFDATFEKSEIKNLLPLHDNIPPRATIADILAAFDGIAEEGLDFRTLPVSLGWTCVNCNPSITSIPYVLSRTKQDALRCIRWLAKHGCFPTDDPNFSVETWAYVRDEVQFHRYKVYDGKLVPA